jgi:hypothetical protein
MKDMNDKISTEEKDVAPRPNLVLADRERELLEIKGPCSNSGCRLHYAHSGPCDMRPRTS